MLFLTAFGIKAGLFPLFFWLPASYHTPPAAVGALLAGLLTKVGVYAMIRVFTLLFPDPSGQDVHVRVGPLGDDHGGRFDRRDRPGRFPSCAVVQSRRTHRLHHHWARLGDIGGARRRRFCTCSTTCSSSRVCFWSAAGSSASGARPNLSALGGSLPNAAGVAALAMVPVFSLAGVPPLSGFIGKLAVITAALDGDHYWVAGIALIVSLLTLLSMGRLWEAAFWKPVRRTLR